MMKPPGVILTASCFGFFCYLFAKMSLYRVRFLFRFFL